MCALKHARTESKHTTLSSKLYSHPNSLYSSPFSVLFLSRSTILVRLEAKAGLAYLPGDHVAIYPQNHAMRVNELLERLKRSTSEEEFIDPDVPIVVESKRKNSS